MSQTLESQWKVYRDACYPKGLPEAQEVECRQAYFAGCLTVLAFAVNSSVGLPEQDAFLLIMGLVKEAESVCKTRIFEMKGRN